MSAIFQSIKLPFDVRAAEKFLDRHLMLIDRTQINKIDPTVMSNTKYKQKHRAFLKPLQETFGLGYLPLLISDFNPSSY